MCPICARSTMWRRIEIPNSFPSFQSAPTPDLRQHDALELHDLLDLFGQRQFAAALAKFLLPGAKVVMNSGLTHVSVALAYSAAATLRATRGSRFVLPATRPLVRGAWQCAHWVRGTRR